MVLFRSLHFKFGHASNFGMRTQFEKWGRAASSERAKRNKKSTPAHRQHLRVQSDLSRLYAQALHKPPACTAKLRGKQKAAVARLIFAGPCSSVVASPPNFWVLLPSFRSESGT